MSYALIPTFALAMIVATPVASYAQNSNIGAQAEDIGMREYVHNCAVCHGDWGKGDGRLAVLLKNPVPDHNNSKEQCWRISIRPSLRDC